MVNDENILNSLKNKFNHIDDLVFKRSADYASCPGELYDILVEIPQEYPFVWDSEKRRWKKTPDILQTATFDWTLLE